MFAGLAGAEPGNLEKWQSRIASKVTFLWFCVSITVTQSVSSVTTSPAAANLLPTTDQTSILKQS